MNSWKCADCGIENWFLLIEKVVETAKNMSFYAQSFEYWLFPCHFFFIKSDVGRVLVMFAHMIWNKLLLVQKHNTTELQNKGTNEYNENYFTMYEIIENNAADKSIMMNASRDICAVLSLINVPWDSSFRICTINH